MLRLVNFLLSPLILFHLLLGAFLSKTLNYFLMRDIILKNPTHPEVLAYLEAKKRR